MSKLLAEHKQQYRNQDEPDTNSQGSEHRIPGSERCENSIP